MVIGTDVRIRGGVVVQGCPTGRESTRRSGRRARGGAGIVKVLHIRHRLRGTFRGNGLFLGPRAVLAAAVGAHIDIIARGRGQARIGEGVFVCLHRIAVVGVGSDWHSHNLPIRLVAHRRPVHCNAKGQFIISRHGERFLTRGDNRHHNVVHVAGIVIINTIRAA